MKKLQPTVVRIISSKFLFKNALGKEVVNSQIEAGKKITDIKVWSTKEQNSLGRKMGTEMLKRNISLREVQKGDTIGAITLAFKKAGILKIKNIYSAKVRYEKGSFPTRKEINNWNNKNSGYKIPKSIAEKIITGESFPMAYANLLFPGQHVWVEGVNTVVIGNKEESKKGKRENVVKKKDKNKTKSTKNYKEKNKEDYSKKINEPEETKEKLWESKKSFSKFSEKVNLNFNKKMEILNEIPTLLKARDEEVQIDFYSALIDVRASALEGKKSLTENLSILESFSDVEPEYLEKKKDLFNLYDESSALWKPYEKFILKYEQDREGQYSKGEAYLKYPVEKKFGRLGTWKIESMGSEKISNFPVLEELYELVVGDEELEEVKTYIINEKSLPMAGLSSGKIVAINKGKFDLGDKKMARVVKINELSHYMTNKYFYNKLKGKKVFNNFSPSFGLKIKSSREAGEFLSDVSSLNESPDDFLRILSVGSAHKGYRFSYEFAKAKLREMIDSSTEISILEKNILTGLLENKKLFKVKMTFEPSTGRIYKIISRIVKEFSIEIKDLYMSEGKRIVEHLNNKSEEA